MAVEEPQPQEVHMIAEIPSMVIPVSLELLKDTEGLSDHLRKVLSGEIKLKPYVEPKLSRRERLARWLYETVSNEQFPPDADW